MFYNQFNIIRLSEEENATSKRYCDRAEIYARKTLGETVFDSLFADGQKMSLDAARNLALKTLEGT